MNLAASSSVNLSIHDASRAILKSAETIVKSPEMRLLLKDSERFRWDLITSEAIAHRKTEQRAWILERLGIVAAIILLCIAMSDGPWFPWANFAALGLLWLMVRRGKKKGIL